MPTRTTGRPETSYRSRAGQKRGRQKDHHHDLSVVDDAQAWKYDKESVLMAVGTGTPGGGTTNNCRNQHHDVKAAPRLGNELQSSLGMLDDEIRDIAQQTDKQMRNNKNQKTAAARKPKARRGKNEQMQPLEIARMQQEANDSLFSAAKQGSRPGTSKSRAAAMKRPNQQSSLPSDFKIPKKKKIKNENETSFDSKKRNEEDGMTHWTAEQAGRFSNKEPVGSDFLKSNNRSCSRSRSRSRSRTNRQQTLPTTAKQNANNTVNLCNGSDSETETDDESPLKQQQQQQQQQQQGSSQSTGKSSAATSTSQASSSSTSRSGTTTSSSSSQRTTESASASSPSHSSTIAVASAQSESPYVPESNQKGKRERPSPSSRYKVDTTLSDDKDEDSDSDDNKDVVHVKTEKSDNGMDITNIIESIEQDTTTPLPPSRQRQRSEEDDEHTSPSSTKSSLQSVTNSIEGAKNFMKGVLGLSKRNNTGSTTATAAGGRKNNSRQASLSSHRAKRDKAAGTRITVGASLNDLVDTPEKEQKPEATKKRRLVKGSGIKPLTLSSTRKNDNASDMWDEVVLNNNSSRTRKSDSDPDWNPSLEYYSSSRRTTRSATRRSKKKQNETIEIMESSDEEAELETTGSSVKHDAVRIAIGKKIVSADCHLTLKNNKMEISFRPFTRKTRSNTIGKKNGEIVTHEIDSENVKLMQCFLADEAAEKAEQDDGPGKLLEDDDEEDQMSFLAMRIEPTDSNGLKQYPNMYKFDAKNDPKKMYVVVEFRTDNDLLELMECMRGTDWAAFANEESKLDSKQAKAYTQSLLEDSKLDAKKRRSAVSSPLSKAKRGGFLAGRKGDDILVVYPFGVDKKSMEEAASGLKEAGGVSLRGESDAGGIQNEPLRPGDSAVASAATSDSDAKNISVDPDSKDDNDDTGKRRGRAHYLTIRVSDYERLEPGEFLNDTLIDFWMQWICRQDDRSQIHIFSSHFYTTLLEEGVQGVTKWTKNKGIDVFEKKLIFFPINMTLHWSLCVVVNPGYILQHKERGKNRFEDESQDDLPFPFIFFFDSLKAHRKLQIANRIRKWLNSEWVRLNKSEEEKAPFTARTMNVYSPTIPYQDNSWDCGVFVCRYSYAMFQLRHHSFSYNEVDAFSPSRFVELITKSPEFDFNMDDIDRIRSEMKTLIEELSKRYLPWREEEDRKEKEAKAAAKKKKCEEAAKTAATMSLVDDSKASASNEGTENQQQEKPLSPSQDSSIEVVVGQGSLPSEQVVEAGLDAEMRSLSVVGEEKRKTPSRVDEKEFSLPDAIETDDV